jgi:hypothetical protein
LAFNRFRRFVGFGCHRFCRASTPFGFAAEAVDTEFLEELEMGAELIGGHD